jgi:Na+-translocating ferredoxin:NAD+ oxidoreductase RNF subunit RnfB
MSPSRITDVTREHRSERMAMIFIFIALAGLSILLIENDATVFNANCMRCYFCVNECPAKAISLNEHGFPVINKSKCLAWDNEGDEFVWSRCGLCLKGCPTRVIDILNTNTAERDKHTNN